jgi:hypothetical protein
MVKNCFYDVRVLESGAVPVKSVPGIADPVHGSGVFLPPGFGINFFPDTGLIILLTIKTCS